ATHAEIDFGHVVAHEHETPAAGALEVLNGGGVGYVGGIETGALVLDLDVKAILLNLVDDANLLGAIKLVAVFDGVDEGFLEGELDAEDFFFGEEGGLQLTFDFFLKFTRFGGIAGDFDGDGVMGAWLAHKVHLTESG